MHHRTYLFHVFKEAVRPGPTLRTNITEWNRRGGQISLIGRSNLKPLIANLQTTVDGNLSFRHASVATDAVLMSRRLNHYRSRAYRCERRVCRRVSAAALYQQAISDMRHIILCSWSYETNDTTGANGWKLRCHLQQLQHQHHLVDCMLYYAR